MKPTRTPTQGFQGLNTTQDPMALGLSWLTQADNCIVTSQKKLERTYGHVLRSAGSAHAGAYTSEDFRRFYVVDDLALQQVLPDWSRTTLATLASRAATHFSEVNGVVFYANGTDYGSIDATSNVRAWGIVPPIMPNVVPAAGTLPAGLYRFCTTLVDDATGVESSNSDVALIDITSGGAMLNNIEQRAGFTARVYATVANDPVYYRIAQTTSTSVHYDLQPDELGVEIPFMWCNPPHGILPAYFDSRMYLADPYPSNDMSIVWRSHSMNYHLFQDGKEGVAVPGTVLMLKACKEAVIVGTERAIYALDAKGGLEMLAPYGVVPGYHEAPLLDGKALFWTVRGLARALPFENLTEETISVAPGVHAGGNLIEQHGDKRYLVALQQGGTAFNPR